MANTKQMVLKPLWRFLSSLRPHKIRNFYGERKYLLSLSYSLPGNLSKIFVRLVRLLFSLLIPNSKRRFLGIQRILQLSPPLSAEFAILEDATGNPFPAWDLRTLKLNGGANHHRILCQKPPHSIFEDDNDLINRIARKKPFLSRGKEPTQPRPYKHADVFFCSPSCIHVEVRRSSCDHSSPLSQVAQQPSFHSSPRNQ